MVSSYEQRNPLRKHAKLGEAATIRLIYSFCAGVSVDAAAKAAGISSKTVRGQYIALRGLLTQPAFNRWHGLKRALLDVADPEVEALIKTAFLDVLADCYFNAGCYRNYQLGNRKARLCRSCSVPGKFASPESAGAAIAVIDEVRSFYARLGIRGENQADPLRLFRARLIHTAAITTARAHSRQLANGLPDPSDMGDLAVGSLVDRLLVAAISDETGSSA
ncbi:MAG: hypothetical protein HQ481_16120 [Alphaproteobacteria bacterium]|nr:hypothetical protein [Alphaproteobacteria bacterium]